MTYSYYRTTGDANFERIIKVYSSAGALRYADASAYVEHCEFSLSAERGCGQATIISVPLADNTPLLNVGDRVLLYPESGVDPWYQGFVGPRRRIMNAGKPGWEFQLSGYASLLEGLPSVDTTSYFGTAAGSGDDKYPSRIYIKHDNVDGIVDWLYYNTIAPSITEIAGANMNTTWQIYNSGTQIEYLTMEPASDVANTLIELARMNPDGQSAHSSYPYPILWGVDANRYFYYYYRPNTLLMRLKVDIIEDANDAPGRPSLYLGTGSGTWTPYEHYEDESDGIVYNVLSLRGGLDSSGNPVEATYEDTTSITTYGRRRLCRFDAPTITSENDALKFKEAFFDRYANPQSTHTVRGIMIPNNASFPLPWAGYVAVEQPGIAASSERAKRTLKGITVQFDDTPTMDVYIGEVQYVGNGLPIDGNARGPGLMHNETENRRPRAKSGGTGSTTIPSGVQYFVNEWPGV